MSSIAVQAYPCDRGLINNLLNRGWHHFEANISGIVVCKYCGQFPLTFGTSTVINTHDE